MEGLSTIESQNRLINFPSYEVKYTVDNCEQIFGENFTRIMRTVRDMPDTFGLCGVLAMHINGLLANPSNWDDISYNPKELKQKFDLWWQNKVGESAWTWFDNNYKNRLTGGPNDFAIVSRLSSGDITSKLSDYNPIAFDIKEYEEALNCQSSKTNGVVIIGMDTIGDIFQYTESNVGFSVAVLCQYALQNGTHTHWLSARYINDEVLVSGNLKPFGIDAVSILVPSDKLLLPIQSVIGATPTTLLTKTLANHENSDQGRNLHNEKMFLSNMVRRVF